MRWTTWLWSRLLVTLDKVWGSHLVEWELARRQRKIERLLAEIAVVDQDLQGAAESLAFYQMLLCLIELKARSERDDVEDWLFFSPHSDGEEQLLDSVIECLVKTRLASVDVQPSGPGCYSYQLTPDWTTIITRLRHRSVAAELVSWLELQMQNAQSDGGSSGPNQPACVTKGTG